jgi:hypothetical protein
LVDRLDAIIGKWGLQRDPDRTAQPGLPAFASWSEDNGSDNEIDYHAPVGETSWLELRGADAGTLAAELAKAVGIDKAPTEDNSLEDLLALPRAPATSAMGDLRWQALRESVAAAVPANASLVRTLVAAGLQDGDWRVRMTAVLATGRLGLNDLAQRALAASVPAAGTSGLDQEDRRALLALRQAAHDLASGTEPGKRGREPGDPDLSQKGIAFQRQLRAMLRTPPAKCSDRASGLVMTLLDPGETDSADFPSRWRSWTGNR